MTEQKKNISSWHNCISRAKPMSMCKFQNNRAIYYQVIRQELLLLIPVVTFTVYDVDNSLNTNLHKVKVK